MNLPITPDDDSKDAEFVRLLVSHQLDLHLYVQSLVFDFEEAADIVQNANAVLWKKRSQFVMGTNFRAWALQIARYEISEYRSKSKRRGLCFTDAIVDELSIQATQLTHADNELMDDLRRCVAQLAAVDRDLLEQRYSLQASCESIAKKLGRPVHWVYNTLSRIRQELRNCVARTIDARRQRDD